MRRFLIALTSRRIWLVLALGCLGIAIASIVLTAWLRLNPCHLCIFQRLLFMLLALFAAVAAVGRPRLMATGSGIVFALTALGGAGVAAYQSWLQWQPAGSATCADGPRSLLEVFVDELGEIQPDLFLASGLCENVELSIVGLSLANLAFLAYVGCFALAVWAMTRRMAPTSEFQ